MNDLIEPDETLAHIRSDADRLAACVDSGDAAAPVAGCPGWDLRKLVVHMGFVHRWATVAIRTAEPPTRDAFEIIDDDASSGEVAEWLRDGADPLVDALTGIDPDAPTWHPFPVEQRMWVWPRRQLIETAIHRWDGEHAIGRDEALDTRVATVGLDEFFDLGLPRVVAREGITIPESSLHLHCTDDDLPDGAGEWIVWNEGGELRVERAHRKGDAALRGTASDLLLVMTGRLDRDAIDVVGDASAAAAWLDLPGL